MKLGKHPCLQYTVIAGGREFGRAVLPLYEFGRTMNVALPRRK